MKKILPITLLILALFTALIWGGVSYLNSGYVAEKITSVLQKDMGARIQFAKQPHLSIFPLQISLGSLHIDYSLENRQIRAELQSGTISVSIFSLLTGNLALDNIFLDGLRIEINESAARAAKKPAAVQKDNTGQSQALKLPQVQKLTVQHGMLTFSSTDLQLRISGLNLSAENLLSDRDGTIKCDFALQTGSDKNGDFRQENAWNTAMSAKIAWKAPNLILRKASLTVTPAAANFLTWAFPLHTSLVGTVNLNSYHTELKQAELSFPLGRAALAKETNFILPNFKGRCILEVKPNANASGKGKTVSVATDAACSADRLNLANIKFRAGQSSGSGNLDYSFARSGKPAALTGSLTFNKLDTADLPILQQNKNTPVSNGQKTVRQTSSYPQLALRLALKELKSGNFVFANIKGNIDGAYGTYALQNFSCNYCGGILKGNANYNLPAERGEINLGGQKINLGSVMRQFGVREIDGGTTDFKADILLSGSSWEQIKNKISGRGSLAARDIKIRAMEQIIQLMPILSINTALPQGISLLKTEFAANNGIVLFSPIQAEARGLKGKGKATLDLQRDYLDGRVAIKFLHLDLPIYFRGPLGNISFGLENSPLFNFR